LQGPYFGQHFAAGLATSFSKMKIPSENLNKINGPLPHIRLFWTAVFMREKARMRGARGSPRPLFSAIGSRGTTALDATMTLNPIANQLKLETAASLPDRLRK